MQGTGAITLAAAVSAVRVCGAPLRTQRVIILGAGTAGLGIADQIRDAMMREGLSLEDATARFWLVDAEGLLTDDMGERLHDYQAPYARPHAEVKRWKRNGSDGATDLAELVRQVHPTMLIGVSTSAGAFTEAVVREMAKHCDRPIIFPLSNPAPMAEASPADLISWTEGRALIATGSPFPPVTYRGVTYVIGQVNNAMLYPGLCLGAIVSRARRISDSMLAAAANAVSSLVAVRLPGASLLPHVDDLRNVSLTVAVAVAEAAVEEGLAGIKFNDIVQQVGDAMWEPEYRHIQAL
jgi:malate dehydrogenase (oxaloacetate-decarboxylating)